MTPLNSITENTHIIYKVHDYYFRTTLLAQLYVEVACYSYVENTCIIIAAFHYKDDRHGTVKLI